MGAPSLSRRGALLFEGDMKEVLTILMLVLLIGPLLIGVRRVRRLLRKRD